jgi:hypothetical protein
MCEAGSGRVEPRLRDRFGGGKLRGTSSAAAKIRVCVACIFWIWIAAGCGRDSALTNQSPGSRAGQSREVEELRQRAQETDRNPPTENEDRAIAALWASMSEMAPPPNFMGRDPPDKDVAEQNRLFAAAEIAQAVEDVGLEKEIPLLLVRGTVDVAVHHMSREEREKLKGWEAPVRVTAVACFLVMSNLIGRESGHDQAAMYLQRMNLQVQLDRKQLVLKTKMPGGGRQAWPQLWLRLFTASFHRPLVILPTDSLRRELWNWVDGKPSIGVQARDGSVLATGALSVPSS